MARSVSKRYLVEEYLARVNKAIDFIQRNLDKDLSLDELAHEAAFSKFHFHRLFKALVGETLSGFIRRLRLEKAANMLVYNPKTSITEVALSCGFSSSQLFCRNFKRVFGLSASEFRNQKQSKNSQLKSNDGQDSGAGLRYIEPQLLNINKGGLNMKVKVKDVPKMTVAYVRHIGPYKGDSKLFESLFGKLAKWAGPRGLMTKAPKFLSVYYDDPKVTEDEKLRVDVCLVVPEDTKVEGEVGKMTLEKGKYAVAHFELRPDEYEKAWNQIYGEWLPKSGYQPDDRPCFELYLNDPKQHPEGKCIVDIHVPVKPL